MFQQITRGLPFKFLKKLHSVEIKVTKKTPVFHNLIPQILKLFDLRG
jgi:hypothetical protein